MIWANHPKECSLSWQGRHGGCIWLYQSGSRERRGFPLPPSFVQSGSAVHDGATHNQGGPPLLSQDSRKALTGTPRDI